MKLAEALQERADLNRKIEQLRARLTNNCLTQEGEKPAEDPAALLRELDEAVDLLQKRIAQINLTNCRTVVEGRTLTAWLAEKDCLTVKLSVYRNLVSEASQNTQRARYTEIKILPTVNVAALQAQADALARDIRLVDNRLQESNWLTELMED